MKKPPLCIFIPSLNEGKNIPTLVEKIILCKLPPFKVILVIDESTDNTLEVSSQLAEKYSQVEVIYRKNKSKGRGHAGKDGWLTCLKYNPDYIMEMDADHSHDPKHIPEFLAAQKKYNADVVIGSRYTSGGREVRGAVRKLVSYIAEKYFKIILGVPFLTDPSSGFRLFTRKAVETFNPATLTMPDHRITPEILFRVKNLKIVEVPITFHDRKFGQTKLKWPVLVKSLISPLIWRLQSFASSAKALQ